MVGLEPRDFAAADGADKGDGDGECFSDALPATAKVAKRDNLITRIAVLVDAEVGRAGQPLSSI